jgi:hypothetical protein
MKISSNDPRIDIALNSYPLVELPHGFTAQVISTIRKEYPRVRCRLQFLDFALPMFFSIFSLLLLGICAWGMNQLDPMWIEYLKLEIVYAMNAITPVIEYGVDLVTLFGIWMIMFCSLFTIYLIYRPRKILRI